MTGSVEHPMRVDAVASRATEDRIAELSSRPHRRWNPLLDEHVLVSAGRILRPWQGDAESATRPELRPYDPDCYLCPGNARANDRRNPVYEGPFVFTNDFAALRPDVEPASLEDGLLNAHTEAGESRVVCFSPRHDRSLGELEPAAVRAVVDTWADQTTELGATYPWVQVFENHGRAMGASNPHPHGQIWACSELPREAVREDRQQRRHHAATGRPLLLDYADQEAGGERVVDDGDAWLTVVPFWASWPYETLVMPRRQVGRLADLDPTERDALAGTLGRLVRRYDRLFDRPFPYSMGWHQAPFDGGPAGPWQLHAHFYPPLLRGAVRKFMVGFELLAEPQRDLTAEVAAAHLRRASPDRSPGDAGAATA